MDQDMYYVHLLKAGIYAIRKLEERERNKQKNNQR